MWWIRYNIQHRFLHNMWMKQLLEENMVSTASKNLGMVVTLHCIFFRWFFSQRNSSFRLVISIYKAEVQFYCHFGPVSMLDTFRRFSGLVQTEYLITYPFDEQYRNFNQKIQRFNVFAIK